MNLEIVAEIGASHCQDLDLAKRLCRQARDAGADWVKIQTYTPDTITFRGSGVCGFGPWRGRTLYDLYTETHMPRDMQEQLILWMLNEGIPWFSTPFSYEDVRWLEERGCPRYKISSFDAANREVGEAVVATGKYWIISDGLRSDLMSYSSADMILRCSSAYPAYPIHYGLGNVHRLRNGKPWGVSDHTQSATLGVVAIGMGARMIEAHVAEDGRGADAAFARSPEQFREHVRAWRAAEATAGATEHVSDDGAGAILPKPVQIGARTLWRRCVS